MAQKFHQRNVINAISIENQPIGSYLANDGAFFRKFPGDAQPPTLPGRTNIPDTMVGDGSAYDKQGKPGYYDALNKPWAGALNTTISERIFRMWLGGVATPTANALPGTVDYSIAMLSPGAEPLTCTQIRTHSVGGAKFFYGDVFVAQTEISQQGSGQPRMTAQFSNGGHHRELEDLPLDPADIEDAEPYLIFDGKKTTLTFSDGVNSYNLVADKRMIDVTFTGNQNVDVEQLPGDPALDPNYECQGGYTTNLSIDVQSANIRVKAYMDSTFHDKEFNAWKLNKKLTSIILTFRTCEKIGLTTHNAELEIKIPVGEFTLETDTQNNKDAIVWNIKAIEGDPITGSLVMGRIRKVGDLDETI